MITSAKNSSSCGSISKPSTIPPTNLDSTGTPAAAETTNPLTQPGRIRSSSSCPYLPIFGGLSGPASPAEVTKEIAFGGVVDNSGKFSPRIVESEGGYFALRNTAVAIDRDREPASPRRITSSTSLVAAGTSGAIITRDCGWGEMVTGIETEGVGTVHHHHHYFYHHRRTSSGTYETPEELLLRVKTKASSSNLSFHQQIPTTPIQRSPSSLSLSFTPTVSNNTSTSTVIGPPLSSSGLGSSNIPTSAATSSVSKTTAKPSLPRSSTKTSPKSSLRLRLPPPPKVQIDALGIGVQHILLPHHPYHRFFPNTPDGRAYEKRRESAPSLLVPGIHSRVGDWLLTPPEEVGGMLWHCPTDNIDEMADRQAELEGDDAKSAKYASRPATSDGTLSYNRDAVARKVDLSAHVDVCKEKNGNKITEEGEDGEEGQTQELSEDEDWGVGEEWLKGAAEVLLSSLSPVRVIQEAVRVLSYTLPCPLPTAPDPAYVSVGASTTATHQGRLPASAKDAPAVAAMAGQELSPAITARCSSKRPNAGIIPIGSQDGVTTTIHTVTSAIQRRYSKHGTKRVYINVSHAIPPHIPLNRLPSIPPAPGPGGNGPFENSFGGSVSKEGGCYFAPTVFNSIVVAMGETPGSRLPGHLLMSNPILPPNSLHFSLLERFIPPNSAADDAGMFSPTSSILVDRLVELNDNRGSLLFIYPTKTGARQFVKNILGPVLDPLLRKLMVLHRLPTDLLWRIRNMPAVDSMADWDDLKHRMEKLVAALSRVTDGSLSIEVAYASTQQIRLNDESWREWWSQQEQMRIREIVKHHYASIANMLSRTEQSILAHEQIITPSVTAQNLSSFPFPQNAPAAIPKSTPFPKKSTSSKPSVQKKGDSNRAQPPTAIELPETQIFTPTYVTPMSPEASAHYLGIRSPNMPISPSPIPTTQQTTSISPSSHSSSGFTMGYGPPGDLAREVIDGVRALAIRPSSKGMGEAVMASALAGSGGNTAVAQGMGGVVGEAVGRKEGGMNRDRPGSSSWRSGARESGLIEVGVFVLRRVRR